MVRNDLVTASCLAEICSGWPPLFQLAVLTLQVFRADDFLVENVESASFLGMGLTF